MSPAMIGDRPTVIGRTFGEYSLKVSEGPYRYLSAPPLGVDF